MSPRGSDSQRSTAPTWLLIVAVVSLTAGTVMSFWGAVVTGVSVDEPYHVLRLGNYFEHGWYLLRDDLENGHPVALTVDRYVYGPVTALLAHLVNVLVGVESLGKPSMTADAFAVRHVVVAAIGTAGLAGTALMGRLVMRSWSWGVVCAGTLAAIPAWTGMAMMNIKDLPVGTGFTLATCGLMLVVGQKRHLPGELLLVTGVLLAIGTRPGIWPGIAAGVGLVTVWALVQAPRQWATVRSVLGATVAILILLVAIYPRAFFSLNWPLDSVQSSSDYYGEGHWWMLPLQVWLEMPLLMLLITVVGWLSIAASWRAWRDLKPVIAVRWALVLSQGLLLPTLIVLRESSIFNGLRLVLFAAPAVAVLVVAATRAICRDAQSWRLPFRGLVAALASAMLLAPMGVQARMFPYNYAYASPLIAGVGGGGAGDYWRTGFRHSEASIPANQFVMCEPMVLPSGQALRHMLRIYPWGGEDCRRDELSLIRPFRPEERGSSSRVATSFIALRTNGYPRGSNCEPIAEVSRPRYFERLIISEVVECELFLLDYEGKLEFGYMDDTYFLLDGWAGHPTEAGVSLRYPAGSFGFTLDDSPPATDRVLRLRLSERPRQVKVNNVPVRLDAVGDYFDANVPSDVVDAMGGRRFVVTIEDVPGLELFSAEVVPQ